MKRFSIVLVCAVSLVGCARDTSVQDAQRIGAFCDATMRHARDSHDSLQVMLACVQMIEIARLGHNTQDANAIANAALAVSISNSMNAGIHR